MSKLSEMPEKEVILMRDSIDNSYASKYGYASDGTRWVLLSYAKVEMQRVEQQRDELQAKCDELLAELKYVYNYLPLVGSVRRKTRQLIKTHEAKARGQQ